MDKWRGIPTTQVARNEDKAKTIINPFKQKSISLPRIDDGKRWAGYPGLTGISRRLAKIINKMNDNRQFMYYIEPFAGTAKVYQEIDKSNFYKCILNDKSKFTYDWLRIEFSREDTEVTNVDFVDCMRNWDNQETLFVIDGPWNKSYYLQKFSCFDRESVKAYDTEIVELCKTLRGKFMIASRKENKVYLNSGFKTKLVESEYPVSGKYPKTLITHNLDI